MRSSSEGFFERHRNIIAAATTTTETNASASVHHNMMGMATTAATTTTGRNPPPLLILPTKITQQRRRMGEVVPLDMMQYCNAEMELPLEKHFDMLRNVEDEEEERIQDDDDEEHDDLEDDESGESSSADKSKENRPHQHRRHLSQRNDSSSGSSNSSASDKLNPSFRPLPTKQPNRDFSLLENGTMISSCKSTTNNSIQSEQNVVVTIAENTTNPTYHPALRAAVCAEGQEAMWMEDEYSTVSSIFVQPKKRTEKAIIQLVPPPKKNKPPKRHSLLPPFFYRSKQKQGLIMPQNQKVENPDPVKIHVKRKKVKKSVVLLPQEDDAHEEALMNDDNHTNNLNTNNQNTTNQKTPAGADAITDATASVSELATIQSNMIRARQLLNAALLLEQKDEGDPSLPTPRLEKSEAMARFAFEHAQTARRLAESSCHMNNNTILEHNKELEDVLNYMAEQGQEAVYQHQHIVFSNSSADENEGDEDEADSENVNQEDPIVQQHQKYKTFAGKEKRKKGFGEYAARAVHYLESILPKHMGENSKDAAFMLTTQALSAEDFWSDAGISTLGMNNDTFEYGFSCSHPQIPIQSAATAATNHKINMDLMSLSSLNEILDGPMAEEPSHRNNGGKRNKDENSLIKTIPVIDVPHRKQSAAGAVTRTTYQTPKQGGILGLITPNKNSSKCRQSLKNLLTTPRRNDSSCDTRSATRVTQKAEKKGKKWNVIHPKKIDEQAKPAIFFSEGDERADLDDVVEVDEDFMSDAACGDEDMDQYDEEDQKTIVNTQNDEDNEKIVSLRELKSETIDSNEMEARERYEPTPKGDANVKPSTSVPMETPTCCRDKTMKEQAEEEWTSSVYDRNITKLQTLSVTESGLSSRRGLSLSKSYYSLSSYGDEQSDWDESLRPGPSIRTKSSNYISSYREPVGKTPLRDREDSEMRLSKVSEKEKVSAKVETNDESSLFQDVSQAESNVEVFLKNRKEGKTHKSNQKKSILSPEPNKSRSRKASVESAEIESKGCEYASMNTKSEPESNISRSCKASVESAATESKGCEDVSMTKSEGARSDGSKTKIFVRIVNMLGHKRHPLVPNAVVEETFVVTESLKKAMSVECAKGKEVKKQKSGAAQKHKEHQEKKSTSTATLSHSNDRDVSFHKLVPKIEANDEPSLFRGVSHEEGQKGNTHKTEQNRSIHAPESTSPLSKACVKSAKSQSKGTGDLLPAGASESSRSEGSKTKIFGRIVDMVGKEHHPLVPKAVVEETFVVTESLKKAMSGESVRDNEVTQEKLAAAKQQKRQEEKKSKSTTKEDSNSFSPKESKTALPTHWTVFDDCTAVIEQAVSHGNSKAIQSNEEEAEAPPNYLALMLKNKVKEERRRAHEDRSSVGTERTPVDADSFVAAIRGPRHQECPGVALEGVANRNPSRDPAIDGHDKYEIRHLAPTPRRPEQFKSLEGLDPMNDHDPPLDDARERQRMITERLYLAGSSSFNSETIQKSKGIVDHHVDLLKTVETVDSAASYEDETEEICMEGSVAGAVSDAPRLDPKKKNTNDKKEEQYRARSNRSVQKSRPSFLPAILKRTHNR